MIGTSCAFSIEGGDIPDLQNSAEHGPRPLLNGIPFDQLLGDFWEANKNEMTRQPHKEQALDRSEGSTGGVPVQLADLPHATRIPKVPTWWSSLCWLVFFIGVAVMLFALATLGGFGPPAPGMVLVVFGVLPAAFLLAATNTFCSAIGFDKRQRELVQWIQARMNWRSAQSSEAIREKGVRDKTPYGEIAIRDRGQRNVDDPLDLHVSGLYAPREYQSTDSEQLHNFQFAVYVNHIRAETHAARTSCAKLAAALAGVFITGIQVYARLVHLIEAAERQ